MDQEDNKSEGEPTIPIASMVYKLERMINKKIHVSRVAYIVLSPIAIKGPRSRFLMK